MRDGAKIQHPFSIALFEDMVYWSDWQGQQVEQGNKFHGGNHTLIHAASFKPMDLHVVHPLQQPKGKWKTESLRNFFFKKKKERNVQIPSSN